MKTRWLIILVLFLLFKYGYSATVNENQNNNNNQTPKVQNQNNNSKADNVNEENNSDYTFKVPDESSSNKNSLKINGAFEGIYEIHSKRKDSPFYWVNFYNISDDKHASYLNLFQGDLYLNLDFVYKKVEFHGKSRFQYINPDDLGFTFFELFNRINFSANIMFELGVIRFDWGKGYAWNPVGFVNPEKDPEDPSKLFQGEPAVHLQIQKSFNSKIIQAFAINFIGLPVFENLNNKFGRLERINFATKIYFLFLNTDIDFMFAYGKGGPYKIGVDLSRNIGEAVEIHGEFAYEFNFDYKHINSSFNLVSEEKNIISFLIGFRITFVSETTIILEYYYNGGGFDENHYNNYYNYALSGYNDFINTSNTTTLSMIKNYQKNYFNNFTLKRNYLYFKIQQKDMFALTYFNPYLFLIFNIDDKSLMLSPVLSYAPFQSLEFTLYINILIGKQKTEYGDKHNKFKTGFKFKVFF